MVIAQLPSISAAQALQDLETGLSKPIGTGLDVLDRALVPHVPGGLTVIAASGGVQKGQITEVWGPPGSGKTSLG